MIRSPSWELQLLDGRLADFGERETFVQKLDHESVRNRVQAKAAGRAAN